MVSPPKPPELLLDREARRAFFVAPPRSTTAVAPSSQLPPRPEAHSTTSLPEASSRLARQLADDRELATLSSLQPHPRPEARRLDPVSASPIAGYKFLAETSAIRCRTLLRKRRLAKQLTMRSCTSWSSSCRHQRRLNHPGPPAASLLYCRREMAPENTPRHRRFATARGLIPFRSNRRPAARESPHLTSKTSGDLSPSFSVHNGGRQPLDTRLRR